MLRGQKRRFGVDAEVAEARCPFENDAVVGQGDHRSGRFVDDALDTRENPEGSSAVSDHLEVETKACDYAGAC